MDEITPGMELVDSTQALIILRYWHPGAKHRPNTRHLTRFYKEGLIKTRYQIKLNEYLYLKSEIEELFVKLIQKKTK
jgi:hypothetical protein